MFIESIVSEISPNKYDLEKLSYLALRTTNQVYLVFYNNGTKPEYVLRIEEHDSDESSFKTLEELYAILGELIAQPIGIYHKLGKKIIVIKGLNGQPWFQISRRYTSVSEWNNLRNRTIETLHKLQKGVSTRSEWSPSIMIVEHLQQALKEAVKADNAIASVIHDQVKKLCNELKNEDTLNGLYQHGDYCLNNLMIDEEMMHVIDFDDFGMTSVPLHDEFSLAISIHTCAPDSIRNTLKEELKLCAQKSLFHSGYNNVMLSALFMHHLLIRLGSWSSGDQRQAFRTWLLSLTEAYCQDSCNWFD